MPHSMTTAFCKFMLAARLLSVLLAWQLVPDAVVEAINATIEIDWDSVNDLDYRSAQVGDTIEFTWNGTQTIYLQTSDDDACNISQAIRITDDTTIPPLTYTFTSDEAYSEVIFASSIQDGCFVNDTLIFSVQPTIEERPGDCNARREALEQCMDDSGGRGLTKFGCRTCISTIVAGATIGLGSGECLGDGASTCASLVDCPCQQCYFQAAALGSCDIDRGRGEECPITDCSEQVGAATTSKASRRYGSLLMAGYVAGMALLNLQL